MHLFIGIQRLVLHTVHSNLIINLIIIIIKFCKFNFHFWKKIYYNYLNAIFLVVLAFFLNMGLVYPPKPDYLASYLLLPKFIIRYKETLSKSRFFRFFILSDLMKGMLLATFAISISCFGDLNLIYLYFLLLPLFLDLY